VQDTSYATRGLWIYDLEEGIPPALHLAMSVRKLLLNYARFSEIILHRVQSRIGHETVRRRCQIFMQNIEKNVNA
jgi:hypothetical protein